MSMLRSRALQISLSFPPNTSKVENITLLLPPNSQLVRTGTIHRNAQVQVWLAPVPFQSCVGAIANRGQWEQGCSLFMTTDLGPVRATHRKKTKQYLAGE